MDRCVTRYLITNLRNPHGFARKIRRWMATGNDGGYSAIRVISAADGAVEVEKSGSRPWAELAGYMTRSTQIIPQ